ncbi:ribonuclease E inhibitor RraB [Sphingomonas floccifaciens]|uniref:Ribonuclease E inhibitor RraB n=1 Tax=Sphingomonas floccifaciens TaxID=1844115 RepID=A0ABW4NET3_9SPHN
MTLSPGSTVAGEADQWMLFERMSTDGYPLIILVRNGDPVVSEALKAGLLSVVSCKADSSIFFDNGLPQYTDRIYPIEDKLAHELERCNFAVFHVASVSGEGQRRLIYAHAEPVDFERMLKSVKVEGYSFSTDTPLDHSDLIDLITPSATDRQLSGDMSVISNLSKNGDDGTAARKTDFWFYGATNALEALIADLTPWGFAIDHWLDEAEGVVLTTNTAVDLDSFKSLTPVLVATAETHGVKYDGWETFVVSPEAPEPDPIATPQPKSLLSKLFGAKKN